MGSPKSLGGLTELLFIRFQARSGGQQGLESIPEGSTGIRQAGWVSAGCAAWAGASGGEGAVGDLTLWVLWVLWVWGIGVFFGSRGSLARGIPFFRVLGAAEGAFAAEQVVVVLGESVGFVAHVLEQSQCEGIAA